MLYPIVFLLSVFSFASENEGSRITIECDRILASAAEISSPLIELESSINSPIKGPRFPTPAVTSDGAYYAIPDLNRVKIYSVEDAEPVKTFSGSNNYNRVAFTNDGSKVIAKMEVHLKKSRFTIWDLESGKQSDFRASTLGASIHNEMSFSRDGKLSAFSESSGRLKATSLYMFDTWQQRTPIASIGLQHPYSVLGSLLVLSPDGSQVLVVGIDDWAPTPKISLFGFENRELHFVTDISGFFDGTDGSTLEIAKLHADGVDPQKLREIMLRKITFQDGLITRDNKYAYLLSTTRGIPRTVLSILDLTQRRGIKKFVYEGVDQYEKISYLENKGLVALYGKSFDLVDPFSGDVRYSLKGMEGKIVSIGFDPATNLIRATTDSGIVQQWRLSSN